MDWVAVVHLQSTPEAVKEKHSLHIDPCVTVQFQTKARYGLAYFRARKEQVPLSRFPELISRLLVAARLVSGSGEACCRAKRDLSLQVVRGFRVVQRGEVPTFSQVYGRREWSE